MTVTVDGPEQVLEDLLGRDARPTERVTMGGAVIGVVVALRREDGTPFVLYPDRPGSAAVSARSIVPLNDRHVGKEVLVVLERGDFERPIVVGLLQDQSSGETGTAGRIELEADGDRMVIRANDRLVLKCGKSSITLTKEGKIVIEGAYVATSASGVNRIKGGSVQIN